MPRRRARWPKAPGKGCDPSPAECVLTVCSGTGESDGGGEGASITKAKLAVLLEREGRELGKH